MLSFESCGELEEEFVSRKTTFNYAMHNGEVVSSSHYDGMHPTNFGAIIGLIENENQSTDIIITLNNTVSGLTYKVNAHEASSDAQVPYGGVDAEVFSQRIEGNDLESVFMMQTSNLSFDELLGDYDGLLVIKDPLRSDGSEEVSDDLILAPFAKRQDRSLRRMVFEYAFNAGQVNPAFAYTGDHPSTFAADVQLDELATGNTRISVRLMNTVEGEMYATHVHDMADTLSTPNNTPYLETPNTDIFAQAIEGNGAQVSFTNFSTISFQNLTEVYNGFFVVHDPFQEVSTSDPSTFLVLRAFARSLKM